ncbi:hypothetical protein J1N35_029441 [Gossypium stocksii]|uniref:Reverse transcriptase zinc-binding domain-containing protein n=1 Tax=Gossypium stocksii TaxID=47602 RepID=A0A9D3UYQ7_9ROSI|nr:hypothetical protein J1N35_029441 [Gossypium stocksii]
MKSSIGNSKTVHHWKDNWVLNKGSLKHYVLGHDNIDPETTVSEMILPNGDWNLDLFRLWLPEDVVKCIISIPPPSDQIGPDILSWSKTTIGVFFVKSAYYLLKKESWYPKEMS